MTPAPDIPLARTRDTLDPADYRRIRRRLRDASWVTIAPGVFAEARAWHRLHPHEKHRLRVEEVSARLTTPAVLSHFAAASIWGIDVLGDWPELVDVTIDRATGGRTSGAIRRRAWGLEHCARVGFGIHEVTTPAQTALDLARILPFVRGVSAIDQAIWSERPGGALTSLADIAERQDAAPPVRGDARARRALHAARPLSANVRETQMRLLVEALGFGPVRLQERRVLRSGRVVFGDLYFPGADHWLEVDGRGKYLSPEYTHGRTPEQVVIDEKNRENEIRREVRGFSRLEARDADNPQRVYDILTADGLVSRRPRPRTASR